MNILGIQAFYYSHAAALLSEGRLSFFNEEEKFSRVKGVRDGFPLESISAALAHEGIGLDDVSEIAYPLEPWRYSWTLLKGGLSSILGSLLRGAGAGGGSVSLIPDRILTTLKYTPPFLAPLIRQSIRHGGLSGRLPKVFYVPHHRAHAASAFYSSGLEEAAVVIIDGMGERECTTIWRGRGTSLELLDRIAFPNSLGEFYAAITEFCGFKIYQQEGKLMGLAAYGEPDEEIAEKMTKILRVESEGYRLRSRYTIDGAHSMGVSFSDALVDLLGEPRRRNGEITDRFKKIAFAAQDSLERATAEVIKKAVRLTGLRKVCFSGGVAMNCKLNGFILNSGLVDDLFALPASNDAGAALGAAMVRALANGMDPRMNLEHTYYGAGFTNSEIEALLKEIKVSHRPLNGGSLEEVADLLIAGKILGLYTGRSEFGARALGARSILADPRSPEMAALVNASVKRREHWRPFAPVILEGFESDYFVDGRPSPFMMKAFAIRPEQRDRIPAVVHVDGTCRPQSISREVNPLYFDILEAFHRKTGVPVLLNTSFNVRGEPIVCRPIEALRCYLASGMDALVIGRFLLRKDSG
ncbi:MAG: carbamoyltransferase C-terminal domain-containing protein [Myxococcota bacterium]